MKIILSLVTIVFFSSIVFSQTQTEQAMQSKDSANKAAAILVQWTNFQNAAHVLGQSNFTTATAGTGNNKFNVPSSIAVDAATGKVFVSDFGNNRVLRFSSLAAATNGGAAEAVIGQTDFATVSSGLTQNKFSGPQGIFVDSAGRLWLTDTNNSRVLRFDNAAAKPSGANADGVLGQPDFTTATAATTQNGMNRPSGIFADSAGHLYVSEQSNNRVLRFDNAAAKANGANADGVLGQSNFTTATAATTQNGMRFPLSVVGDSAGRLWVSESNNNRVLRFDNAASKANGANADGVLGQSNFTTATPATTRSGMQIPVGLSVDATGLLYVADSGNNRILIFDSEAALGSGTNAANVLGQPDFTTAEQNNPVISASSLFTPRWVFFDEGSQNLFVSDRSNNRVLRFGGGGTVGLTISGRVIMPQNLGLTRALVTLTDNLGGNSRTAFAGINGQFIFTGVAANQLYNLKVQSKRYQYTPQNIFVTQDITDLTFSPQ